MNSGFIHSPLSQSFCRDQPDRRGHHVRALPAEVEVRLLDLGLQPDKGHAEGVRGRSVARREIKGVLQLVQHLPQRAQ